MQQHGSKYFARRSPLPIPSPLTLTLGMGSMGQNSTFSEHGHVAYQIKENHECSNMVAPQTPLPPTHPITPCPNPGDEWGQWVRIQLFQNMVILHIKLKRIMNAAAWLLCRPPPPPPPPPAPYVLCNNTIRSNILGQKYLKDKG